MEPNSSYTASAVIDEQGTVAGWSEGARRLLGYTSAEVLGREAAFLLTEDSSLPALTPAAGAGRCSGRVRLRCRDGGHVEVGLLAHHRAAGAGGGPDWLVVSPVVQAASVDDPGLLERAFLQGPCAVAVYDKDARVRRANALMEEALGLSETEMRGLRVQEIVSDPQLAETSQAIREVLESGRPQHRENFFRTPGMARKQAWAVFLAPLRDVDGTVNGVCLSAHDETRRHWAQQRLHLLNEASARIGSTLDIVHTAQELADVAVLGLADYVGIDVLPDGGDEPPVSAGGPVTLRHLAHGSVTQECPEIALRPNEVASYEEDSPQARCLAAGRTVHRPGPDGGLRARRIGSCCMTVPMRARGAILGTALFGRRDPREPFDPDDRLLAEEITARAAVCIDNARRYARQRGTALTLQRSLLPQRLPRHLAISAAARYMPAGARPGVGGDWYDVIPLSGARVALVVGDVVGHGIQASAAMGRLRTAVRTLADVDLAPDELLTHLDDLVIKLAEETPDDKPQQAAGDIGATCLYAVYDPVSGRLVTACAGHPPPVIAAPGQSATPLDCPVGPPLGLGGLPFESKEIGVPEGSLLAFYTDGLIEARDRDIDAGIGMLCKQLTQPVSSVEDACDAVVQALLPERPADDAALLMARTRVLDAARVAAWDVPPDPSAVASMRKNACTATGRVGPGGGRLRDGTGGQRTRDERPAVRAAAHRIAADPRRPLTDLRSVGRQQHRPPPPPRPDAR